MIPDDAELDVHATFSAFVVALRARDGSYYEEVAEFPTFDSACEAYRAAKAVPVALARFFATAPR